LHRTARAENGLEAERHAPNFMEVSRSLTTMMVGKTISVKCTSAGSDDSVQRGYFDLREREKRGKYIAQQQREVVSGRDGDTCFAAAILMRRLLS
jgi:hypothetical protein